MAILLIFARSSGKESRMQIGKRFVAFYGLLSPGFEHVIRVGAADELEAALSFETAMILA